MLGRWVRFHCSNFYETLDSTFKEYDKKIATIIDTLEYEHTLWYVVKFGDGMITELEDIVCEIL